MPRGWRRDPDGRPVPPAGFDKGAGEPGWRYAIRLGLQDVERITDGMIESLLLGRPFTSVADLRLRSVLSQPVVESLAHAGALDVIGGVTTGGRTRRDVLLEVTERWSGLTRHRVSQPHQPQQLGLLEPDPDSGLPEYRPSERVRAELEVVGMDTSRHVISFYDTLLDTVDVTRAVDLLECREHQVVRIAGVKVATQTPPVKSGQRVIFLSLDDSTGVGDATFFESVHETCAWTVFHTWLLVVEGRIHRSGRRGVSLTATRAWDLRRLMIAWQGGWLDAALAEEGRPATPTAPPVAPQRDHDGAPSEAIRGAAGRSGLVLPGREGEHLQMVQHVPFGGAGPAAVDHQARRAVPAGYGDPGGSVGSPSRIGPNGTTWADPAGRHPGVDPQDITRLSRNDPRHPTPRRAPDAHTCGPECARNGCPAHAQLTTCAVPGCAVHDAEGPSRKLWHSSTGSAGR